MGQKKHFETFHAITANFLVPFLQIEYKDQKLSKET